MILKIFHFNQLNIPQMPYFFVFLALQFHLEQAKLRSKIRIQDGRGIFV